MMMKKLAGLLGLSLLIMCLNACGTSSLGNGDLSTEATTQQGEFTPSTNHLAMLNAINQARSQPHICHTGEVAASSALDWNQALSGAAKTIVKNILARVDSGQLDLTKTAPPHEDSSGNRVGGRASNQGYDFARVGENLAYAPHPSGDPLTVPVVQAWLGSSKGHCEEMLFADYEDLGVYFERGVWATVFGKAR